MKYEQLIETISAMVEDDKIIKEGLTLIYELPENDHKRINEILFYKSNPPSVIFEHNEEFEVELGGMLIKFIQIKTENNLE